MYIYVYIYLYYAIYTICVSEYVAVDSGGYVCA